MLNRTTDYFNGFFEDFYADRDDVTFLGVESSIAFTLYGEQAAIPEPRFDIYINFDFTDVAYTEDSTVRNACILSSTFAINAL